MTDQFYTNEDVARDCLEELVTVATMLEYQQKIWLEPAAGTGSFFKLLPHGKRVGFDIDPKCRGVLRRNFCQIKHLDRDDRFIVVSNLSFGKLGQLAREFIEHSFHFGQLVGFILPANYAKYSMQSQLPEELKLVHEASLPPASFHTEDNKPRKIQTVFQVWTTLGGMGDLRLREEPPSSHPDFVMHQYNNTEQALKVFDEPFDFAVPCQGWQDYKRQEYEADQCEKNVQWMLFKPSSFKVELVLRSIDFGSLAEENATAVPGFRQHDVVAEYQRKMDERGQRD